MKRAHRSAHRLIWLLMVPVLAATLWLAIDQRRPAPVSEIVPATIITEEVPY